MRFEYQTAYQPNPENTFEGQFWNYRRQLDWFSLPHLHTPAKKLERENIEKKYGRNNPFVKSMLYGEFQGSSEGNDIFGGDDLAQAKSAMRSMFQPVPGYNDIRAAGDIADTHDKQILMIREGTEVLHIDEKDKGNDIECAEYWVETLKHLGIAPWQFTIDGGGLGATVANYMELRLNFAGLVRFHSNNSPMYDTQFFDRYTELHWIIKYMLTQECIKLPFSAPLLTDMRERQYVEMTASKIKCEPKPAHRKRCEGRSPDYLDSLVYLFNDFPSHSIMAGKSMLKNAVSVANERDPTPMEIKAEELSRTGEGPFQGLQAQPDLAEYARSAGLPTGNLFTVGQD